MSLCLFVRDSNNNVLMTSDSALSTHLSNEAYRIANLEDCDKIFYHNGYLIFCSGSYPECTKVRSFIRGKEKVNLFEIQKYLRQICTDQLNRQLAILVVYPNGIVQGMLSVQDFKIDEAPYPLDVPLHTAIGERQDEANQMISDYNKSDWTEKDLINIYHKLTNELVGNKAVFVKIVVSDSSIIS